MKVNYLVDNQVEYTLGFLSRLNITISNYDDYEEKFMDRVKRFAKDKIGRVYIYWDKIRQLERFHHLLFGINELHVDFGNMKNIAKKMRHFNNIKEMIFDRFKPEELEPIEEWRKELVSHLNFSRCDLFNPSIMSIVQCVDKFK